LSGYVAQDRPYDAYRKGTALERRVMNHVIFERIEVGGDGTITKTALTLVYKALSAWQPGLGRPQAAQEDAPGQNGPLADAFRPRPAAVHWPPATASLLASRLQE
jgi:hypothetical protein